MPAPEYLFDHARQTELVRLRALSAVCDPPTRQILARIGPQPGWRCLDAGSGAGSIAGWLAHRVAPGEVVACDIDTTFLRPLASPTLRVIQHDILSGPVERHGFDLVHARFLVEWLPDWEAGLGHLLASVKPGGVIILTASEWHSRLPATGPVETLLSAVPLVMQRHGGWDPECGRELADRLAARGVRGVQAELHAALARGASVGSDWPRLSIEPMRNALISSGRADEAAIQAAVTALTDPAISFWLPGMISAWGTVA